MARRGLPELDAMTLWIHDPGEAPVLIVLTLVGDLDALGAELCEQRVEIIDAVIDHERGLPGTEVRRVVLEKGPHGRTDAIWVGTIAPLEDRPAGRFNRDSEVRAIPLGERV
jgi:hypothetical protein